MFDLLLRWKRRPRRLLSATDRPSHLSGAKMHRFYMLVKAVHRNATRLSVDNMLHRFPFLAATGLHCPRSHAGVALLLSCMLWRRSTRATWEEATDRSGQRRTSSSWASRRKSLEEISNADRDFSLALAAQRAFDMTSLALQRIYIYVWRSST